MTSDVPDDLQALIALAREYLRTREDLRLGVAVLGRALAALAESSTPAAPTQPAAEPVAPLSAEPDTVAQPAPQRPAVPITSLPPLTFASPPVSPHPNSYPISHGDISPHSPPVIADRCRLKAEACRFTARRVDWFDDRDDYTSLIDQARALPECYLWMIDESATTEPPAVWNTLASAFEAAAEAADLLQVWGELPDLNRGSAASDVLHLAAEAQAVLFAAVATAQQVKADNDQIQLFVTIREQAARLRVFISRYLKREDRADPAGGPAVIQRMRELVAPLRRAGDAGRNRQKALSNLRYKAKRLKDDPTGNANEWPRVVELLDELVTSGLPASNAEVRDLILPILDLVPDEFVLPPGAERVFREVDRYLASRPAAEEPAAEEQPSLEVVEIRQLLAGQQMVLIGGQVRPARQHALIEAFGLTHLDWITTVDHESISIFEGPIARPEVAVVLLAIRWSNHSYGDVQEYCRRYGKLLVRLPGGYHPNQVAHQILSQVGHRLRAAG